MMKAVDGPPAFRGPVMMSDLQAECQQTVDIMRGNLEKVLERDCRLAELEDKSERLKDGSSRFQRTSRRLKRQQWWASSRWLVYTTLVVLAVIGTVVCVIVL